MSVICLMFYGLMVSVLHFQGSYYQSIYGLSASSIHLFNGLTRVLSICIYALSSSIRGSHSSTVYSYHASHRVESNLWYLSIVVLSYLWVSIPVYLSELNLCYLSFLCSSISILSVRVYGFLLSNLCVNVCVLMRVEYASNLFFINVRVSI